MKNSMKSAPARYASCMAALYISTVLYLSIWDSLEKIALFPALFAAAYCCLMALKSKAESLVLHSREDHYAESPATFFMQSSLIILFGQCLYWMAYYPGGFNLDAYGQWDQVHGLQHLNNWHPVVTTAWYWLLTRICDNFAFCIFVQLLTFSLSVSYLLLTLYRLNFNKNLLYFAAIYIALSPAIGMNNVCLVKDVLFAIALVWTTVISIKIVSTKGCWLKSLLHSAIFVANITAVTLIRHNGIFYVIALLLCVIISYYRHLLKQTAVIALFFSLSVAIIQGPVFSALSVEKHSNLTGESVGIPMAIMANNLVSDPDHTPDDVEEFLISIADESEWREKYILGEWDSCKWDFGGTELFQEESLCRIVKLGISSLFASPETAYQSVRENTRVVWQVLGPAEWVTQVYIESNDYGIQDNPSTLCAGIVNHIVNWSTTLPGTFFFWNIGVPSLAFVLLMWLVIARKNYANLILVIPAIAYNLLTMALLCGPSHRYFYFNSVLILPIVLFVIATPPKDEHPLN